MVKKCSKCKVPLEGWRFKYIVKPFIGIMPVKGKRVCNKCEAKLEKNKHGKK